MTENATNAVQDAGEDRLTFADSPIGQILWETLKDAKEMYEPLTVSAGDLHCALATLSTLEQTLAAQSPPLLPVARDDKATIEAMARAMCDVWGYEWDVPKGHYCDDWCNYLCSELADDKPTKKLFREAAKAALLASRSVPPLGSDQ